MPVFKIIDGIWTIEKIRFFLFTDTKMLLLILVGLYVYSNLLSKKSLFFLKIK